MKKFLGNRAWGKFGIKLKKCQDWRYPSKLIGGASLVVGICVLSGCATARPNASEGTARGPSPGALYRNFGEGRMVEGGTLQLISGLDDAELSGHQQSRVTAADRLLCDQILDQLMTDPFLPDPKPRVRVQGGLITLGGRLTRLDLRGRVLRSVRQVMPSSGYRISDQMAIDMRSDGTRHFKDRLAERQMNLELQLNPGLRGSRLLAQVQQGGTINLVGVAQSQSQRRLAESNVLAGRTGWVLRNRVKAR